MRASADIPEALDDRREDDAQVADLARVVHGIEQALILGEPGMPPQRRSVDMRVARQLAMISEDGQDALMAALLGEDGG